MIAHSSATVLLLSALLLACNSGKEGTKFRRLSESRSGIDFYNTLTENDSLNYFTYAYMYMGGGVSLGDINNDGLSDIYFTGNMVPNKLFLNRGNMEFEDISRSAGVGGDARWYTGTTMADVNADGFLDIYVCVSGKFGNHENQLFINNGDLTFTESAEQYGINDKGESIQATFWDYDKDGDLDLFVANYPSTSFRTPNSAYSMARLIKDPSKSDKLYRMDSDGLYMDVTEESGILNFGLTVSAAVSDFNNDGWEDIYVSNDFSTPDYFYLNNGDGTFTDYLREATRQTSFYGMGTDAADVNNDGLVDLIQVDMAPENNRRAKENMASMSPSLFWSTVNAGFHYQYMYNSFQLNRGVVDGIPRFSNIPWLAGVATTDWSWSPLFADFDNDGLKDLFITNGTRKEINNRDFFKRIEKLSGKEQLDSALALSRRIPEEPIDNFIYKNSGRGFVRANDAWDLRFEGFSNGAAFGDLDNDGDLDLVVNNLDDRSMIFENRTRDTHYITVKLQGDKKNPFGVSSNVTLHTDQGIQVQRMILSRGFQSSVAPRLHFGLGTAKPEKIIIDWADGSRQLVTPIAPNSLMTIKKSHTHVDPVSKSEPDNKSPMFSDARSLLDQPFIHFENPYNDFYHQVLLPHKMSNFGPALATGDINGDGLSDVFVGNGLDSNCAVYIQNKDGTFAVNREMLHHEEPFEDMDAVFFDADNDGDFDLYVVSGGNALPEGSLRYKDRLYENKNGLLIHSESSLPSQMNASGSRVIPADWDGDGDLDLLVGGRLTPQQYPNTGTSYLLENRSAAGNIRFEDVTPLKAPSLSDLGMVTDLKWVDLDGDNHEEIVVVGEWMPFTIFKKINGKFEDSTEQFGLSDTQGWWFGVEAGDFDGDGDMDMVGGNLGLNYKYRASETETFDLYVNDFDLNSSHDLVLGYFNDGEQFPVRGRQCSSEQIPAIQIKFKDYHSFASATLEEIYGKKDLANAKHFQVRSFSSKYFENNGDGSFAISDLPFEAQFAPINDMIVSDMNGDGHLDIISAGNLYATEVETPRADANMGLVLLGRGDGTFRPLTLKESGLLLNQDVKTLSFMKRPQGDLLFAAGNQGPLQVFQRKAVYRM